LINKYGFYLSLDPLKKVRKMKKFLFVLFLVALIIIGLNFLNISIYDYIIQDYSELAAEDYNGVDIDKVDNYMIDVEFNPVVKTCKVKQTIDYINKEERPLTELYFHIYPNAFRQNMQPWDPSSNINDSYESGYIEFSSIKINGKEVKRKVLGSDQSLLIINLIEKLVPGRRIAIALDYTLKIPNINHRFGYTETTFNFGNWYPIAAVFDQNGWNQSEYYQIGDPFYSDVSNFNINITAPKEFIIAGSGKLISEETLDSKKMWHFKANLMRDFAWVASDKFKYRTHNLKDSQIKMYFLTENGNLMNYTEKIAVKAMQIFNKEFGHYPYGQISLVETYFLSGGMEYPGLVYLGTDKFKSARKTFLSEYIVHELAHQWWYAVVGNNQITEPWLDEGLATYSQIIFSQKARGEGYADGLYRSLMTNYNTYSSPIDLQTPVTDFELWSDYSAVAYGKGAAFFHNIDQKYGKEDLNKILRTYYKKYRFKNATAQDLFKIYEEVLGVSY